MKMPGEIIPTFLKIGSKTKSKIVLVVALTCAFATFRTIQASESKKLLSTIESILRNESLIANTYALSKTLSDIESLGLLNCARVHEVYNGGRLFYDTSTNKKCTIDSWFGRFRTANAEFTSINGSIFHISVQTKLDLTKITLEILIDILIFLAYRQISKTIEKNNQLAEAKIQAIEIEKRMMVDHARQIRHDAASPLTALHTIVHVIPDMDPELKAVLKSAISRTQGLFNDLNKPLVASSTPSIQKNSLERVDATTVIEEIISEKKSVWSKNVEILYTKHVGPESLIFSNKDALGRVISNLLNNSFEACEPSKNAKISLKSYLTPSHFLIEINDNGKGISPENLSRIGQKGVSIGKTNHETAGSGLGLCSAIQAIKEWSGDLKISSIEGCGTTITIQLPRIC